MTAGMVVQVGAIPPKSARQCVTSTGAVGAGGAAVVDGAGTGVAVGGRAGEAGHYADEGVEVCNDQRVVLEHLAGGEDALANLAHIREDVLVEAAARRGRVGCYYGAGRGGGQSADMGSRGGDEGHGVRE